MHKINAQRFLTIINEQTVYLNENYRYTARFLETDVFAGYAFLIPVYRNSNLSECISYT